MTVEHWVEVGGGVRLHVASWPGSSVPFILVHGLASNARMWQGVAFELSVAGCPASAVDLRGHGQSDKPDGGYTFETVVADLVKLIDALGYDRPVLAGQSWGGNVVLELAYRHPGLVRGVACVDGGTIELSQRFESWEDCADRLAPPQLAGRLRTDIEAGLRAMHPDWPESGIDGMLGNFELHSDGTVAPRLTRERHMEILRSLWEHRPSQLYPSVSVPVLLTPAGRKAEAEAAAAALPRGRLAPLDGDHDLHAQQPQAVAKLLLDAVDDGFFA